LDKISLKHLQRIIFHVRTRDMNISLVLPSKVSILPTGFVIGNRWMGAR